MKYAILFLMITSAACAQTAEGYYKDGLAGMHAKDYRQAKDDFAGCIKLKPSKDSVYFKIAVVEFYLNEYEQAIADFNKYLSMQPNDYKVYYDRALAFKAIGEKTEAIADLTVCLQLNPLLHDAYLKRGCLNEQLNKYSEALADYNRAIELDGSDYRSCLNKANVLRMMGATHEAATAIAVVLEMPQTPLTTNAYFIRGSINVDLSKYQDAITDYNLAITPNTLATSK